MANYGELGYLLAQRRAGMGNQGAASLGYLLGGGGRAQQQMIFNRSALEGARMQDVLAQARQRTQQNIGRENLAIRAEKNGDSELAALIRGSRDINPNTYYEGMGRKQANDYQQKAWELAQAPSRDWGSLNADLAVLNKKPVQVQRSLGDGMYTSNAYEPTTAPSVTPVGSAKISELGALMQEHGAAAAKNYAGANLDRARTDQVKSGGAGKPQAITSELTKAFFSKPVTDASGQQTTDSQGRPVTQIDTGKLTNFMQFANRPGVSANQNAALPQYMNTYGAQNDNPPPGAIDLGADLTGKPAAVAQPAAAAKPNLKDWMTKAKQANPGVSDDELTAFYNKKYGG